MVKFVSLVKGEDRKENIYKALNLIDEDLRPLLTAKNILVKPNLTALNETYANTSVDSIDAVVGFLRQKTNARITVGESSATAFYRGLPTSKVFLTQDYHIIERKYRDVYLTDFDDDEEFIHIPIKSVVGDLYLRLTKRVRDFDYKISLAIPKTHNYSIVTGGIKNMAGLIKRGDMSRIHGMKGGIEVDAPKTLLDRLPSGTISWMRRNASGLVNLLFSIYPTYKKSVKMIHHNIVSIAEQTWPELVILDGYNCMEGDGPIEGDIVNMKIAIASADPLKADGIGVRIMGFEPEEIGYLYYLNKKNNGDYSTEGLVGERIEDVRKVFKRHRTYDIQRNWME